MKNFRWYLLIILFLNGAFTVTAQEKKIKSSDSDIHAPLKDVKKKSDAEENVTYNDPSLLEGFQIRPSHSFLKTRQSQLLKVSDCFRPTFAGEDDLVSLLTECDPIGMGLVPLLRIAKTSNWSVNGIPGGNQKVGEIGAQGNNTAIYTAPKVKPSDETIQVSAEIQEEGKRKTVVVATIIILDDLRIYYGTVECDYIDNGISFGGFGNIIFKESGPKTNSFSSIHGSINVSYMVEECSEFRGKLPLYGELGLWTEEEDRILTGGKSHGISLIMDPFEVDCHGVKLPQDPFTALTSCIAEIKSKSDQDYSTLWGEGTCGKINFRWNLKKQ